MNYLLRGVAFVILIAFPFQSFAAGKVFKAATNSARKRITANMLRKEALRDKTLSVKPFGKTAKGAQVRP